MDASAGLIDRRLRQLARRQRGQRILQLLLPALAWSTILVSSVVAMLRLSGPGPAGWAPGLLIVPLLVGLIAASVAWRRPPPTRAQLAGHLDRLVGAQGLVMALAAQPPIERDEDWMARVHASVLDVRWPAWSWPAGRLLVFAVLAGALVWLVPIAAVAGEPAPAWQRMLERSERAIAERVELGLLPADALPGIEQRLARLRQRAEQVGLTPAVWQGVDAIDAALEQQAAAAGRSLLEVRLAAAASAASADPLADGRAVELARSLARLAVRHPQLLTPLAVDALEDPARAEEVRRQLRRLLRQAVEAGAISPAQAEALERLGYRPSRAAGRLDPGAARQLAARLDHLLARQADRLQKLGVRLPEGGPADGDEDDDRPAPLHFTQQTDLQASAIDGLPPGARLNEDGSITLAVQERAADLDETARQALIRARSRRFDPGAADARAATVAPRHRAAVEQYFQRD